MLAKGTKVISVAIVVLWSAQYMQAAVSWNATNVRLKAAIGQEKAVAAFPFRNAGDQPVRIISVKPSCGCIVAKLEKEVYAPGESGALHAELDLAGAVGLQSKTIAVTTDDPSHPTTVLNLIVDVPEPAIIRPRLLFWPAGSKPEEKSAEVIMGDPKLVQLKGFEASNHFFSVRLESRDAAGSYVLRITPQDTDSTEDAVIRLSVVVAGQPQTFMVYAAVK